MSESIKVKITEAFRITGRGTVLMANGDDITKIHKGDNLKISDREIPIYGVESVACDKSNAGLVMGGGILPKDLELPCDAEVISNG